MTEENGHKDVANEPTNDQLANFACVIISGPGFGTELQKNVKAMFEDNPILRSQWVRYHADFQKSAHELAARLKQGD